MKKQVLILSTSARVQSNSDLMSDAFADGARSKGHEVRKLSLAQKNILFCKGCLACQKTGTCILKDDMEELLWQMKEADVLVFATPVYFYEMSGQMKTLLDRTNPLFPAAYAFREIYLLAAAADRDEDAFEGVIQGLKGWISCFDKANLKQVLKGNNLCDPAAVMQHTDILQQAYVMGASIA